MGGGDIPPGFPQNNPTISYWQLPPHELADHRTSSTLPDSVVDYVIIGSGISGAAIAYKLLTRCPSLSVLMLEARTAASGASGRNGGHCRAGWWLNHKKYVEAHGEEEAVKFGILEEQNVKNIADFVHEYEVDCDFQDVETADTYTTTEAWEETLNILEMRDDAFRKRQGAASIIKRSIWQGEEASKYLGIPGLKGAVTYPAHTLNPYRLVCKMLQLGLNLGLNLQTHTPAFEIGPSCDSTSASRWRVETNRGKVEARNVVLASNGFTNALHSGLSSTGFLRPTRKQVSAIRPSRGDLLAHPVLHKSVGLNDRHSGDYFMVRAPGLRGQGDIVYGGGSFLFREATTDDTHLHDGIAEYFKRSVREVFGEAFWGKYSTEVRDWCGITCYTPDTFPLVGELPGEQGLWASVGMNGHGMAMAFQSAEALVQIMTTGEEPAWLPKSFRIARAWAHATY